ncbi:MAG: hypothetical protein ACO24O_04395 [Arenimonas sp.]
MNENNGLKLFIPGLLAMLAPWLAKRGIVLPDNLSEWILTAIQGVGVAVSGWLVNGGAQDSRTTITGVIGAGALFAATFGFDISPDTQAAITSIILTIIGFFTFHIADAKPFTVTGAKTPLILLLCAVVIPFSACGKPEQIARGAAQTYVGLNGIADGVAIMARGGEIENAEARKALAGLSKVNLTAEVFSQRLQAGGYSKTAALDAANQVLFDLRALYNQQIFSASEPAKVRWQLLFFAAETGINTAKLVIAKKQESKTEARKAAIAAGDAIRGQITARAASRGISPASLTELIALAQRVTVDIVTVSLMSEAEAWAYRADLADALKTKLN